MASFRQLKEQREAKQSVVVPQAIAGPSKGLSNVTAIPAPDTADNLPNVRSHPAAHEASTSSLQATAAVPVLQHRVQENPEIQLKETDDKGRGLFWCPSDGRRVGRGEYVSLAL